MILFLAAHKELILNKKNLFTAISFDISRHFVLVLLVRYLYDGRAGGK
jgi:hypothetical protein